jgi:Ca-activated chloride channel homolog
MTRPALLAVFVGILCALVVAAAEALHARRVRRVGRLAFGPEQRPRPWTRAVPPLRAACLGAFAWALATLVLMSLGYAQEGPPPVGSRTQHLVFIVDLSPSMSLEDAGPKHAQGRRARAAEVVAAILDRVGGDVSFSVIAFYANALPVVMQVRDRAVVRNALDDMPLAYALGEGRTDLATSLSQAMDLIQPFGRNSATVLICTDGDTVPLNAPLAAPPSVRRSLVLGVGDTGKGTFIDGHQSRQDPNVLRAVAASLGCEYINVNDRHVATTALEDLVPSPTRGRDLGLTEVAILVMLVGGLIAALIPAAQQYGGTGWHVHMKPATGGQGEAA